MGMECSRMHGEQPEPKASPRAVVRPSGSEHRTLGMGQHIREGRDGKGPGLWKQICI